MTKLFLMLCMSALAFTGCFVMSSVEGYSSISGRYTIAYCKENPQTDPCPNMVGMTEMRPQDVKPVMKLMKDSLDKLYGASNPSAWEGGYFNLPIVDENGDDILYGRSFSVESGSILATGTEFRYSYLVNDLGGKKFVGHQARGTVSGEVGGNSFGAVNTGALKGRTMLQIAIFDDLGKYFFMPPLRFAP